MYLPNKGGGGGKTGKEAYHSNFFLILMNKKKESVGVGVPLIPRCYMYIQCIYFMVPDTRTVLKIKYCRPNGKLFKLKTSI